MNIFVLHDSPTLSAQAQCDKHVTKMVLETAQLLCGAFPDGVETPYRRTHHNHPCAKWTRSSRGNFLWLAWHGLALADEFTFRYGKAHKSRAVIEWCLDHSWKLEMPDDGVTPFAQAMPDEYKRPDAVEAYRAYYRGGKADIATWNHGRPAPEWWAA